MFDVIRKYLPLFDAEGGGAPGGGEGGDGGEGGGDPGDAGGGAWTAPEGIPSEFIGANADETLGKLLGGFNDVSTRFTGMRDKLSKMPAAPKTPDLYSFEPGENLSPFFGDLSQDKMFSAARDAAHKHGMSQEQFSGFLADTFGPMAEAGLLSTPFDAAAELTSFQNATGLDKAGVSRELQATDTFAKGLIAQLDIPQGLADQAKGLLLGMTDTAAGNIVLQALAKRMNASGFGLEGRGGNEGALTEADLHKLDADPRIDPANREHSDPEKRFDPELRQRYDAAYKRLYG
ncbi:hypothetical protein [Martelella alba]|uniref:hypothetical protein n=1 Tax=Martelella alba TaxID=2590451 RepID=UPI0015E86703|nr:hypothetical protein [Martelella alba]